MITSLLSSLLFWRRSKTSNHGEVPPTTAEKIRARLQAPPKAEKKKETMSWEEAKVIVLKKHPNAKASEVTTKALGATMVYYTIKASSGPREIYLSGWCLTEEDAWIQAAKSILAIAASSSQ